MRIYHSVFYLLLGLLYCHPMTATQVLHTEKSLYRNISVVSHGSLICLIFETRERNPPQQTCMDQDDQKKLVFNYTKMILSGLLYKPEASNILIIGLGGGTLPNTLAELKPQANIDSVEIDAAVITIAKKYFNYQESDKIQTHERDGRIFVKREKLKNKKYDWIILDAFNGDYIPEHLMTQEFLQEVKSLLTDDGIVTANTFSESDLYAYESATYQSVFGDFYNVRKHSGNRIVLATNNKALKSIEQLKASADHWLPHFKPYDVDSYWLLGLFSTDKDWQEDIGILTDQYSPANLLKHQ